MRLQEIILDIAEMYAKFPRFYFPVRLDMRGRLYCMPNYFNYQSTELAKALILFAEPSIIMKGVNIDAVEYLISYGVNCFGGSTSKQSLNSKLAWEKHNRENILNFQNGILINKAKDKWLFLAFCIEYKRFMEFMDNENIMEFHTHLPIQLDATCNGFQHLALLSNEETLFKELNIESDGKKRDSIPGDFYSFLLHRVLDIFTNKVESEDLIDSK
jgi:DNA-directed RNA polymerase